MECVLPIVHFRVAFAHDDGSISGCELSTNDAIWISSSSCWTEFSAAAGRNCKSISYSLGNHLHPDTHRNMTAVATMMRISGKGYCWMQIAFYHVPVTDYMWKTADTIVMRNLLFSPTEHWLIPNAYYFFVFTAHCLKFRAFYRCFASMAGHFFCVVCIWLTGTFEAGFLSLLLRSSNLIGSLGKWRSLIVKEARTVAYYGRKLRHVPLLKIWYRLNGWSG